MFLIDTYCIVDIRSDIIGGKIRGNKQLKRQIANGLFIGQEMKAKPSCCGTQVESGKSLTWRIWLSFQ